MNETDQLLVRCFAVWLAQKTVNGFAESVVEQAEVYEKYILGKKNEMPIPSARGKT